MDAPNHVESLFHLNPIAFASPCREEAECFIADAFLDKHGAQVREFLPELVGLQNRSGDLRAVAGYRSAATGALFLEQYLAGPIEHDLSTQIGAPVPRGEIVEVGNLAGGSCRSARHLVSLLPRYLLDRGYTWVVFTATGVVREILTSVGASLVDLARADGVRLAGGAGAWGRYYENDPRVMAGHLHPGIDLSARRRHRR